jgi:hypothetical protein
MFNFTTYELNAQSNELIPHCFVLDKEGHAAFFERIYNEMYTNGVTDYAELDLSERHLGVLTHFLSEDTPAMTECVKNSRLARFTVNTDGTAGVAIREYLRGGLNT